MSLAFAATLVTHAVLYPPFRAPDERAHVDMARATGQRVLRAPPLLHQPDEVRWVSQQVREAGRRAGLDAPPGELPPLAAADAPPRERRPSFSRLAPDEPGPARNQMTQHPPAYYVLTGTLSAVLEGSGRPVPFDLQVVLLRLLSAVLVLPLPLLATLTARRLGADGTTAVAAGLLPLGVPMLAHIGAAVNNDALLVAAVAALTPLLVGVAAGTSTWPRAVAVGALGALALLTKGTGLFVPAWIALAYALGAWRPAGGPRRRLALHGAVALALASGAGGWWWARNLAVLGVVQPQHAELGPAAAGFSPDWPWWAGFALQRFSRRFWIEPDVVDGLAPVALAATVALAGLVVAGGLRARRDGFARPALVALLPAVATVAIVGFGAAHLYRVTGGTFGIHGRYTYPAVAGIAALAALGLAWTRWRGPVLALTGTAVLAANLWAVSAALARYWGTPEGGLADSARALAAWSPLPPAVVAVAAAVHLAALVAATVVLARSAGRQAASVRSPRATGPDARTA